MQSIIYWLKWLFTKTYPAGRVLGIPLRVHLLFLIFLPFMARNYIFVSLDQGLSENFSSLLFGGTLFFLFVGVLYGSIILHEFGHAWGNRLVGGSTDHVVLTPIGGVCFGYGLDSSPKTELIVVALGPAVSILLIGVGAILKYGYQELMITYEWYSIPSLLVLHFFDLIFSLNLMLALFNLLVPIYPMDSARLLRALFSFKYNPQRVTLGITRLGIGLAIIIIFLSMTRFVDLPIIGHGGIWLSIIAFVGIQACLQEQQRIQHQDVYSKHDQWSNRQVYYDSDIMSYARRKAASDLGPFGRLIGKKGAPVTQAPSRRGTIKKSERLKVAQREQQAAEVIDLSLNQDPANISDKEVLNQMMRKAAETENYQLAGKIKKRLRELE